MGQGGNYGGGVDHAADVRLHLIVRNSRLERRLAAVALWGLSGFFRVEPDELGVVLRFEDEATFARYRDALQQVVDRHDILRTPHVHMVPRTIAPRTACPCASIACALTNGAAASTRGCVDTAFAVVPQSARRLSGPTTCRCEATPRMRVRSSFWKPFITDSTMISAATPSAMPSMDTPEMKAGTTCYLGVNVEGALWSLGDGHYRQGEGEACGTAVEGAMNVTVIVDLIKGAGTAWPRLENDDFYMAVGSSRPLEDSWRIGQVELVRWFEQLYNLHTMDAYQLLSQMTHAPIANVVDVNYSVVLKAAKQYLPTVGAYDGMHALMRERAASLGSISYPHHP